MRKYLFILTVAATCLFSCGKQDDKAPPVVPARSVSFNVSGITQEVTYLPAAKAQLSSISSPTTQPGLKDVFSSLKFVLFDANGKLVLQKIQTADSTNFGTFSARIKDGKYTAFFIGGPGNYSTELSSFNVTNLIADKDTFIKKVELDVAQQDKVVDLTLDRFGAKLRIQLTDPFPPDVTSLKLQVKLLDKINFATSAAESTQPSDGLVYEFDPKVRTKDATLELFTGLFPGQSYTVTAFLKAYTNDGTVVYNREIKGITLEYNKLTTVTGNAFFDYNAGFTIKVNTDYLGNINQSF